MKKNCICSNIRLLFTSAFIAVVFINYPFVFAENLSDFSQYSKENGSILITSKTNQKLRITPYGSYMVRIQAIRDDEEFYADNHYEMVEHHTWPKNMQVEESNEILTLKTDGGVALRISKSPLKISFYIVDGDTPVLEEDKGITWEGNRVEEFFIPRTNEHFSGFGHPAYGRINKLDLRGTTRKVTSGSEGACIVPFYLSSAGYGIFLNTTFTHAVSFCTSNTYSLSIDGEGYGGQMDYFFIAGPLIPQILDRYTQLVGRPRLLQKSMFGLHLSDKSDPQNNGEAWWKNMVKTHRDAGYALDHQVNDNAWRASNEQYSGQKNSWFEFRKDRYPDPAAYKKWCDLNGITVTLDLNRPGIPLAGGWKSTYNIPGVSDCPDFTNPAVRTWLWQLFFKEALDPALSYPNDAIWLDEFDYPDHNHSTQLANGRRWAEEAINYHLLLIKACVAEGWDPAIKGAKRPYFWSRGTTAGAQRWSTYWTGDLDGSYEDMAFQVRAMQIAGLSGYPYFNHDAGGHHNLKENTDNIYRQWDMGFGSFTPIWKPHGPSHKRWPSQNSAACKEDALKYCKIRYQMIPYIYTYAHIAASTGIPMTRPMFLEDQYNETAWQKDMQYMWGKECLVAPNCSDGNNNVSVWLPEGQWYDFWNDKVTEGKQTINYNAPRGVMPVFVKAGSIIPMAPYAKSTFFIPPDSLNIHVYSGINGSFTLYEDDGVTEKYKTHNEFRTTQMNYTHSILGLRVHGATGSYSGAPDKRAFKIIYHGLPSVPDLYYNGEIIHTYTTVSEIPLNKPGVYWANDTKCATVLIPKQDVKNTFIISSDQNATRINTSIENKLSKGSFNFVKNRLDFLSAEDIGPISVTLSRLNGCVIQKSAIVVAQWRKTGYHYSFQYNPLPSGIYVVQMKCGKWWVSERVIVK